MNIINNYTASELIEAMLLYVANRKKNDKHSIAYKIGMIDHWQGLYAEHLSRPELLDRFKSLLNEQTIYKLIRSEYTETQLLNYLKK